MTHWLLWLVLFYLGAIIGSFLNVVIYRVPRRLSLWRPRSFCPNCRHPLSFYDNIPIVSYLWLKGRCRYCRHRIRIRYLLVEIISGLLWVIVFGFKGWNLISVSWIILLEGLLCLAWIDQRWGIIPDKIVISMIVWGTILYLISAPYALLNGIVGMVAAGGLMLGVALLGKLVYKREAVGGGDIKLAAAIGLFLGVKLSLFSLFASFTLGGLYGALLIMRKKLVKGSVLPLAPFLFAGVIFTMLFGSALWQWYLKLFAIPL